MSKITLCEQCYFICGILHLQEGLDYDRIIVDGVFGGEDAIHSGGSFHYFMRSKTTVKYFWEEVH